MTVAATALPNVGLAMPLGYGNQPPDLRDLVIAADSAGLHSFQVGELASAEVFSLLSAAAAATESIRLDTAIVAILTRSPALLAMAAATMDSLFPGRFVLGLGVGSPIVASWHGKDFYDKPLRAMNQTVRDVRKALAGEALQGWGGFRLTGIEPRPSIPIFMSAMNDGMLRAAGRLAEGVIINFCDPEQIRRAGTVAREARAAAGIERPFEVVANLWAYAGDDPELGQRRLRWETAPYHDVPTYRAAAVAHSSEDAVDRVGEAWREGGRSAAAPLVPQAFVDAMHVGGGVKEFRARVEEYGRAGADTVRFVPLTSLGGGVQAAHDVVDVVGQIVSGRIVSGRIVSGSSGPAAIAG